ncbi:aspartyl-phosphate phosphatase Spo0E family protein [Paenibacillus faecis]|uniref:Aspartyl-phosphate phosphatase Spo0E family protein n=2 Tax=Paenibacillus TaxID=44249 RepID=A0A5D0D4T5_9BACL|nr:aspartyl-phosphate phosphatase Spo0E family protein [Paenibacillus faecis]
MAGIVIAGGNQSNQWIDEVDRKASPQAISLEDEIHLLRSKMEMLFQQENSFTSDIVIEISSLLDLKINEFMKIRREGR